MRLFFAKLGLSDVSVMRHIIYFGALDVGRDHDVIIVHYIDGRGFCFANVLVRFRYYLIYIGRIHNDCCDPLFHQVLVIIPHDAFNRAPASWGQCFVAWRYQYNLHKWNININPKRFIL